MTNSTISKQSPVIKIYLHIIEEVGVTIVEVEALTMVVEEAPEEEEVGLAT